VLELDASAAAPRPPREGRPPRRDFDDGGGGGGGSSGPTEELDGVVKWYDPARGFGFVLPSDGGKDVFVHVTALRRAGIDDLQPGQNVRMHVAQARRGREAADIQLLG
jgi:CspA family cold shock protein